MMNESLTKDAIPSSKKPHPDNSFESENSTSLDNISTFKQSNTNNDFDSETESIDNDSEIAIFSYEDIEDESVQDRKIIESISKTLQQLLTETKRNIININSSFNCTIIPQISIYDYLNRIVKYTNIEQSTLVTALIYIDRLCQKGFTINEHNIHKLLFTSILIGIKYNEDDVYKNSYYSQIAGVTMKELIRMENEFLSLIDFNLFIETNLFDKYKNGLVHSFFL